MEEMLFSIIIPTYNRASLIRRCLESVINQTYKNWEAIVVDNFSEDNTEEIVSSLKDSRIRFFKNHNYGVISVSRNYALERVKGEWVCFLDSDDSWAPDKLEQLMPYVNKYDILYHGFQTNSKKTIFFSRSKIMFYTIKESSIAYVLKRSDPISPSCAAVSRNFLGNTRFDESEVLFAIEDYDFFLQLLLKNPRVYHLKKYLTYYDATTGVSHNSAKQLDRNRAIIAKYKPYLNKNDFREVLKYYMYLRGLSYLGNNKKKARKYFGIACYSNAWFVRKRAIAGFIMSFLK